MSLLDILGYAGNLLDLPGSSVRDLLSGNNPFDQWATPFSGDRRASGRDVLTSWGLTAPNEETGMSGWLQNPIEGFRDLAGFGFEMATDPTNLIPAGWFGKALKGRKAARTANAAADGLQTTRYGFVNPKVAAREMAPENPMRLLGYDPDVLTPSQYSYVNNEALHRSFFKQGEKENNLHSKLLGYTPKEDYTWFEHGGYNWQKSATPTHPYGKFDLSRIGTGEGGQAYGPGAYKSSSGKVSKKYRRDLEAKLDKTPPPPNDITNLTGAIRDAYDNGDIWDGMDSDEFRGAILDNLGHQAPESVKELLQSLQDHDWLGWDMSNPAEAMAMQRELTKVHHPNFIDIESVDSGSALERVINQASELRKSWSPPKTSTYSMDVPTSAIKDRLLQWEVPLKDQGELGRRGVERYGDVPMYGGKLNPNSKGSDLMAAVYMKHGLPFGDGYTTGGIPHLLELGASGMSNPARIDPGARNFAIWDQNVLDQMRIRAIDDEKVPINPILGPKLQIEVPALQAGSERLQQVRVSRAQRGIPTRESFLNEAVPYAQNIGRGFMFEPADFMDMRNISSAFDPSSSNPFHPEGPLMKTLQNFAGYIGDKEPVLDAMGALMGSEEGAHFMRQVASDAGIDLANVPLNRMSDYAVDMVENPKVVESLLHRLPDFIKKEGSGGFDARYLLNAAQASRDPLEAALGWYGQLVKEGKMPTGLYGDQFELSHYVPVNPMYGPVQTAVPRPQAGSQALQSTMTNPITRQPLPSLVPPAVAGVVYNALARNNPRGGMQ